MQGGAVIHSGRTAAEAPRALQGQHAAGHPGRSGVAAGAGERQRGRTILREVAGTGDRTGEGVVDILGDPQRPCAELDRARTAEAADVLIRSVEFELRAGAGKTHHGEIG